MTLSIWLAFLAGLASFLSPCVFSLVPAYIGYLAGRTIESDRSQAVENSPFSTFVHGVFFVAGFSMVFILLGMAFSAVGNLLYAYKDILAKIGGVVVILFGIHMTGIYRFPFLEYDLRPHNQIDRSRGFLSSFLLGVFFSAGWSPCVGPVLGAILALALNQGDIQMGTTLLIFYSLGMAIPFLIAALGVGWVGKVLRKYAKVLHYVEIGMGGLLIIIGILLIMGIFSQLAGLGMPITFGL